MDSDNESNIRNNRVVEEMTSRGFNTDSWSTVFSAYPLEISSDLLTAQSDVVYMPCSPSSVPLTFSPVYPSDSHGNINDSQQPVCHGLLFPYASEDVANAADRCADKHISHNMSTEIPNGEVPPITTVSPSTNTDLTAELQILLLKHLIALYNSRQYDADTLSNPKQDYRDQGCAIETPTEFTEFKSPGDSENISTFLVPVEATFQRDPELIFQIKPRDETFQTEIPSESAGYMMGCPSTRLVLHPLPQHSVPSEEQEVKNAQMRDTQAFTLTDLKNCLNKGSLELPCEENSEIVANMMGRTKPGFVLLSIKREKIAQDDQFAGKEVTQPASAPKKSTKRRRRISRCDTNPHTRSLKKFQKTIKPQMMEDDEANSRSRASSSVSRFRVSRYVDKKQTWISPSGASCLVVHDLWTTKLPDYVIKYSAEIMHRPDPSQSSQSSTETYSEATNHSLKCYVCQNNQPSTECHHPLFNRQFSSGQMDEWFVSRYVKKLIKWLLSLLSWRPFNQATLGSGNNHTS